MDVLLISFFSMGREMHSRTTSLSFTWTNLTTRTALDWLLWARHPESAAVVPSTTDVVVIDVERSAVTTNDYSACDRAVEDHAQIEADPGTSARRWC